MKNICRSCKAQLFDEYIECPYCGTKCDPFANVYNYTINNERPINKTSSYEKIAKIGNILSNVSLIVSIIPILGVYGAMAGMSGIFFNAVGLNAVDKKIKSKARKGIVPHTSTSTSSGIERYIFN